MDVKDIELYQLFHDSTLLRLLLSVDVRNRLFL